MKKLNVFVCACVLLMSFQSAFSMQSIFAVDEMGIPLGTIGNAQIFAIAPSSKQEIPVMPVFSGDISRVDWSVFQKACNYESNCQIIVRRNDGTKISSFFVDSYGGITTIVTNYGNMFKGRTLSRFGIDISMKR